MPTLQLKIAPPVLAEASYVIVRELPATDWGYGGQTQKARQLARAAASGEVIERGEMPADRLARGVDQTQAW